LRFPQKLWKMLESGLFRSIWWSNSEKCLAINEDLFKEEVLGREGPMQVFATRNMNSFTQQLNNYGFSKIHPDFNRSPSLTEFLAEEAAASTHSKVLYYYNPRFNREKPYLLEQCKRRVQMKRKALDALKMCEEHPSKSPKVQ
ncbi:HSFY1 protein, partial [Piaya cayana]|nr:HSFY1 protein [Piaya cayana]